jgi:hypothetical protein
VSRDTMAAMPVGMRDERICWLVVHDQLVRRSRKFGVMGWIAMIFTFGLGVHHAKKVRRNRMALYSLAVDRAAGRLNAEERKVLRSERTVPDWFMAEVDHQYRVAMKE